MSVQKLREELVKDVKAGLKNINVFWGPDAANISADERAAHVLELMAEIKKWNALSDEEKMRIQIKEAYESLGKAIKECQFSIEEVISDHELGNERVKELRGRLSRAFGAIEQAKLVLGNWVRNSK